MPDMDELRGRMDRVTLDMVRLLGERTETARQIGQIKRSAGREVTDERREESLRQKVIELCRTINLEESIGTRFLNFLLNESVGVQGGSRATHLSIFLKAKEMEAQGKKIIHMEVGEPDFAPPPEAEEALGDACKMGFTKYGPPGGMPGLRDALAAYSSEKFGAAIGSDNILVTPGARFSIYLAINTLLGPGDEIIIIEPAWPAYRDCASAAGVKTRAIKTTHEDGWEPQISDVAAAINPNTRMIILNYPNNPTGKILDQDTMGELVSLARKNDLYVLSDEIYSAYAPRGWSSALVHGYEKTIVAQSLSKSHAMTGFRIGFAISDPHILKSMSALQALCLTSVPEPVQYAAMRALEADVSANAKTMNARLEALAGRARQMGLEFVEPGGAMYLFARAGRGGIDGMDLAGRLLERGLAVAPGTGFGDYKGHIRLSACLNEKKLMEGMNILDGTLGEK